MPALVYFTAMLDLNQPAVRAAAFCMFTFGATLICVHLQPPCCNLLSARPTNGTKSRRTKEVDGTSRAHSQGCGGVVYYCLLCECLTVSHLRRREASCAVYARALRDYSNIYDPGSLTFKEGDIITVLEQRTDGIWRGYVVQEGRMAKTGMFPANHVALVDSKVFRQAAQCGQMYSQVPDLLPRGPPYSSSGNISSSSGVGHPLLTNSSTVAGLAAHTTGGSDRGSLGSSGTDDSSSCYSSGGHHSQQQLQQQPQPSSLPYPPPPSSLLPAALGGGGFMPPRSPLSRDSSPKRLAQIDILEFGRTPGAVPHFTPSCYNGTLKWHDSASSSVFSQANYHSTIHMIL
ncbi:caskin-2 [Elysia marginata]|uniref:Caskin-2 n=1 Tax=Elysia marginata TaxID=1093978 RepID=A0AAV4EDW4_9GAST|nr:caskin-2 [Elysia marginata]